MRGLDIMATTQTTKTSETTTKTKTSNGVSKLTSAEASQLLQQVRAASYVAELNKTSAAVVAAKRGASEARKAIKAASDYTGDSSKVLGALDSQTSDRIRGERDVIMAALGDLPDVSDLF